MLKKLFTNLKRNKTVIFLAVIGTLSWAITMVKSGLTYSYGMGFWGPNGHDGIWHISLSESLSKGGWNMPVFAGETIKNYHLGFDLFLTIIHKVTLIPIVTLYFQILPVIFSLFIGLFVYLFVLSWKSSKTAAFWSTFFVYFGGSFGWLVSLFKIGQLGGESLFWSQQSISTLVNPPFAMSLVIIFSSLILLDKGIKTNNQRLLMLATFLFGILIQVKVYAGLLMLTGLFSAGIWDLFNRRGSRVFKVFVGSLIISVLIFSPLSKGVTGTIIFKPFWFLEEMMSTPDHFYWPKFAQAMVDYKTGGVILKGSLAYILALGIFTLGNFGSRLLSMYWLFKKGLKSSNYRNIDLLVITVVLAGFLLPIFFVQSGTPWNTIQFLYYSLIFSGILAGIVLGELIENQKFNASFKIIIVVLIFLLTIPTTIGTLWFNYIPSRPPAKISKEELEALKFLKSQENGTVLTIPFNKVAANTAVNNPPRPLYLYESSAYVSALSGKDTYLDDEVNLDITGYDWKQRRKNVEKYLENNNYDFLLNNNIRYLYFVNSLNSHKSISDRFKLIYSNKEVEIFKVI